MVDAPVSGSVITLEQGKLSMMVGGDEDAFDEVKPLLLDIGPKVDARRRERPGAVDEDRHQPEPRRADAGVLARACCWRRRAGIAAKTAVEVLTNSVIASPMVQYRGPMVLEMPDEAWFDVNMMQKDMHLALEMGRQLDVPLPTTAVANELLTAARGMGLAKKDFAVVFEVLATMSGVPT